MILRGYEMVSSSRINFHKSRILSFIIDPTFLEAASDFLAYSISYLHINLLGIPLGVNPRRRSAWFRFLIN